MFGDVVTAPQAILICVFCMVMVFIVLLAISCLVELSAWFIASITGRKKRLEREKQRKSGK